MVLILVVILLIVLFGGGYGYRSGNNVLAGGGGLLGFNPDHPPCSDAVGPTVIAFRQECSTTRHPDSSLSGCT